MTDNKQNKHGDLKKLTKLFESNKQLDEASEIHPTKLSDEAKQLLTSIGVDIEKNIAGVWYGIHGVIVTVGAISPNIIRFDKEEITTLVNDSLFRWISPSSTGGMSIGLTREAVQKQYRD